MTPYLKTAEAAARAAGEVLQQMLGRVQIREKGPRDLVTEADITSQQVIRERLLGDFPDHAFVGEEDPLDTDRSAADASPYCWIVDPLDGTTNYAHRMPMYGVSIALRRGTEIVAGVVYDPTLDEMFSAEAGGGATCNGRSIRASQCAELSEALVAASFAANVPRGSVEVARFVEILHRSQAVRRMGSAALNLSYVAAGRLDAYWATSVKAWDVAAGVLIVREAGGLVTGVDGGPFDLNRPSFVAAATIRLHGQMRNAFEGATT
jgi:myo-inositol-1(or 4)-monophosphatase